MNSELIGKFIQEERKKLNITQEELANMIHVSNKAVSINGKMEKARLALIILFC